MLCSICWDFMQTELVAVAWMLVVEIDCSSEASCYSEMKLKPLTALSESSTSRSQTIVHLPSIYRVVHNMYIKLSQIFLLVNKIH